MVFSLTPFELLEWQTYKKYYDQYIGFNDVKIEVRGDIDDEVKNKVPKNLKKSQFYWTNANKVWNQIYFSLFAQLLGSHKTTRYQHMLCFTSEFYCHNAYALKSTPRGLYGTDAGEHYNDKIKRLVQVISNKFTNYEESKLPPIAIDLIMKYCLWEYYQVREKDDKRNTSSVRQKLKKEQNKRDMCTLQRPSQICNYFDSQGIRYVLSVAQYDKLIRDYTSEYQVSDFVEWEPIDTDDELKDEQDNNLYWKLHSNIQRIDDYLHWRDEADLDLDNPHHRFCYVLQHKNF